MHWGQVSWIHLDPSGSVAGSWGLSPRKGHMACCPSRRSSVHPKAPSQNIGEPPRFGKFFKDFQITILDSWNGVIPSLSQFFRWKFAKSVEKACSYLSLVMPNRLGVALLIGFRATGMIFCWPQDSYSFEGSFNYQSVVLRCLRA